MSANLIKTADFFTGGNATFTVSNDRGNHYTFKIRKPRKDSPLFASLMTGPDNEASFTYVGVLDPATMVVKLTTKSRLTPESVPFKVLNWAIKAITTSHKLPPGYAIQHNGHCCRCGRTLTTPESIERGIGPECAKH